MRDERKAAWSFSNGKGERLGEASAMDREMRDCWSFSDGEIDERSCRVNGERKPNILNKILYSVLQLSYSAILHLESHCSTVPNIFTIVPFLKSGCRAYFGFLC